MRPTPQVRGTWTGKLTRLDRAAKRAAEDVLVGVHEATEVGLSQAVIAAALGGVSPSIIGAKAAKGKAIAEARKRT